MDMDETLTKDRPYSQVSSVAGEINVFKTQRRSVTVTMGDVGRDRLTVSDPAELTCWL